LTLHRTEVASKDSGTLSALARLSRSEPDASVVRYRKYKYVAFDTENTGTSIGHLVGRSFAEGFSHESWEEERMKLFGRNDTEEERQEIDESLARSTVEEFGDVVERIRDLGMEAFDLEERHLESVEALEGISNPDLRPSLDVAFMLAVEGVEKGKNILLYYDSAAAAIGHAERLIDEVHRDQVEIEGNVFQHLILSPSLELLSGAKQSLKKGELEQVHEIVERIEILPKNVKQECLENAELYRYCEEILEGLKRDGVGTQEIEDVMTIARTAFLSGAFARVGELTGVIERKAVELKDRHRTAVHSLREARNAVNVLEIKGVNSEELEELLGKASDSLDGADYRECIEHSKMCTAKAVGIRRSHSTLAERIGMLREESKLMRSRGKSVPDDIDEILIRAEQELSQGNYQDSEEDVEIASLLMGRFELVP